MPVLDARARSVSWTPAFYWFVCDSPKRFNRLSEKIDVPRRGRGRGRGRCVQMSRRKDPSSVRICEVLLEMRRCRMGLIQTADQLRFSYLAVIEGAKFIRGDSSLQVGPGKISQSSFTETKEFLSFLPLKDSWRELSNEEDHPPEFSPPPPPPPLPPPRESHNGKTDPKSVPEFDEIIQHAAIRSLG